MGVDADGAMAFFTVARRVHVEVREKHEPTIGRVAADSRPERFAVKKNQLIEKAKANAVDGSATTSGEWRREEGGVMLEDAERDGADGVVSDVGGRLCGDGDGLGWKTD